MVNTNTLAQMAEQLDLGSYLYLGKGIAKGGGRNLKSLLANAFEAVLGAVFLDAGYDAAYHYYLNRYRSLPTPAQDENFKGRLQQVAQERFGQTPFYDSEGARVGNQREYTSVVFAGAEPLGTGHGATKQEAEQEAARAALQSLGDGAVAPVTPKTPRTPRPRKRRAPGPRSAPAAEIVSIVPEPEPEPEPRPEPASEPESPGEPGRSRQFGEPID
jgi:Ribonuclease-III-like/Double-stranded RNA binding motif